MSGPHGDEPNAYHAACPDCGYVTEHDDNCSFPAGIAKWREAGRAAFEAGSGSDACPYGDLTRAAQAWHRGMLDAAKASELEVRLETLTEQVRSAEADAKARPPSAGEVLTALEQWWANWSKSDRPCPVERWAPDIQAWAPYNNITVFRDRQNDPATPQPGFRLLLAAGVEPSESVTAHDLAIKVLNEGPSPAGGITFMAPEVPRMVALVATLNPDRYHEPYASLIHKAKAHRRGEPVFVDPPPGGWPAQRHTPTKESKDA